MEHSKSTVSKRLIVVIGPIAAGKSTVCKLLTEYLVGKGFSVACVDVDDIASMIHAPGGRDGEHWEYAHGAHGWLVAGWLASPVDFVIVHGNIYTRQETDQLMARVPSGTSVLRVLLSTTYETALKRVTGDSARDRSKDPIFLRAMYDRFRALQPNLDPVNCIFDDQLTAGTIAELIGQQVFI